MPSRFVEETNSATKVFGTFKIPIDVLTSLADELTNWTWSNWTNADAETIASVKEAAERAATVAAENGPPPGFTRWCFGAAFLILVARFVLTRVHRRIIFRAHAHSKRY